MVGNPERPNEQNIALPCGEERILDVIRVDWTEGFPLMEAYQVIDLAW
jgi:hypothetical protein